MTNKKDEVVDRIVALGTNKKTWFARLETWQQEALEDIAKKKRTGEIQSSFRLIAEELVKVEGFEDITEDRLSRLFRKIERR